MKDKKFLDNIKNKLKQEEQAKKEKNSNGRGNSDLYPFWNIEIGDENKAVVRIVPHAGMEQDSIDPFVYKLEHVLSIGGKDHKIPCIKMYDEECPICELSRKYYAARDEEKGKYYYRDKKALASAYIVKDPLPVNEETEENDEGKLKVVQLGNQLATRYDSRWRQLLKDDELSDLPWSLTDGINFNIVKVMKGKFANYEVESDFARKSSSLPEEFLETFEPVDLTKFLPKNPGLDKVKRMLDAHLTGDDFEDGDKSDTSGDASSNSAEAQDLDAKLANLAKSRKNEKVVKETTKEVVKEEVKVESQSVDSDGDDDDDDDDDFIERLKRRASGS